MLRFCFSLSASQPSYMVKTFISCFFIFLWCPSCIFSHTPSISSNSTGISFFPSARSAFICFTAYSSSSLILSPSRCITFHTPPALILCPQVLFIISAVTRYGDSVTVIASFSARFVEISPILSICIASSNR